MHYQNQQRKKFKIKFQVLLKIAQILPDYSNILSTFLSVVVFKAGIHKMSDPVAQSVQPNF